MGGGGVPVCKVHYSTYIVKWERVPVCKVYYNTYLVEWDRVPVCKVHYSTYIWWNGKGCQFASSTTTHIWWNRKGCQFARSTTAHIWWDGGASLQGPTAHIWWNKGASLHGPLQLIYDEMGCQPARSYSTYMMKWGCQPAKSYNTYIWWSTSTHMYVCLRGRWDHGQYTAWPGPVQTGTVRETGPGHLHVHVDHKDRPVKGSVQPAIIHTCIAGWWCTANRGGPLQTLHSDKVVPQLHESSGLWKSASQSFFKNAQSLWSPKVWYSI